MTEPTSVTVHVDAPAERVWALVSDLDRMGEWSPETVRVRWLGGATGATPGARFKGTNRIGWRRWSTTGTIVDVQPGRSLAWEVSSLFGLPVARWSYVVEPAGDGCDVTETTEDLRGGLMRVVGAAATGVTDRGPHNAAGMRATLERVKRAAEQPA